MNVKRRWKPGGRERQRAVTMAWLNKRKQSFGGGDYERLNNEPPLVPRSRKSRREG